MSCTHSFRVFLGEAGEVHVAPFRGQGAVFGTHSLDAVVLVIRFGVFKLAAGSQMLGGVAALGFGQIHAAAILAKEGRTNTVLVKNFE